MSETDFETAEMGGVIATATAIGQGRVSCEDAVRQALTLLGRSDLNCVVALEPVAAIEEAHACDAELARGHRRGVLHGVPLAHKDMFYRAGRHSRCGADLRKDFVPQVTSTLVARLDAAGAITVGRLQMAEFAMSPTGHNAHYGRVRNPWHADAITGGSSSGSGAAVGARLIPASLGSDTGGSIRLPSSFCGATGLKPTQGRLPTEGAMPLAESLDCLGPIGQNSADLACLMNVLHGGSEDFAARLGHGLAGLRIGIPDAYYIEGLAPSVAAALDAARRSLEGLGCIVRDVGLPDQACLPGLAAIVTGAEAGALHLPALQASPDRLGAQVRARLLHGLTVGASDYLRALRLRGLALQAMLEGPFQDCDVLLAPVCRVEVPRDADTDVAAGIGMNDLIAEMTALTRPISFLGLPALATCMGFDGSGLPIGLQLIGRPLAEAVLLQIGDAYEHANGWLTRRPHD